MTLTEQDEGSLTALEVARVHTLWGVEEYPMLLDDDCCDFMRNGTLRIVSNGVKKIYAVQLIKSVGMRRVSASPKA